MSEANELAAIARALEEAVRRGWLEHAGVDDDGRQRYRLTPGLTDRQAFDAGVATANLVVEAAAS